MQLHVFPTLPGDPIPWSTVSCMVILTHNHLQQLRIPPDSDILRPSFCAPARCWPDGSIGSWIIATVRRSQKKYLLCPKQWAEQGASLELPHKTSNLLMCFGVLEVISHVSNVGNPIIIHFGNQPFEVILHYQSQIGVYPIINLYGGWFLVEFTTLQTPMSEIALSTSVASTTSS